MYVYRNIMIIYYSGSGLLDQSWKEQFNALGDWDIVYIIL